MKRSICYLSSFCLALLFWIFPVRAAAQAQQQPATVVIEGGTLIDGNGGAPVRDALIIIQGNRIATVTRKGEVSYPANSQVLRADGKFILPGLWDSETNYYWYMGEAMLAHGVTSTVDIGNGAEVALLHAKAVRHGKIGGPRTFAGTSMSGGDRSRGTGFETPVSPDRVPQSVEEAREIAKRFLAAGTDMIIFNDGRLPLEYVQAAFEEAHKAGKAAFLRASGPNVMPREGILAGADVLPHAAGIDNIIAKDPSKWRVNQTNIEPYSDMDDAKATDLIQFLVQHRVALVPTLKNERRGFQKGYSRFEEQDRKLFSDPNLRAYYPEERVQNMLLNYTRPDMEPAVWERRNKAYQNALRFYRQFVQAGGHVLAGGDAPNNCTPGLCIHHELEIFEEAGFTPIQMIQSVTKWPAEALRVQDELGTIEAGKLADVVIVNEDPLQDIRNLQKIEWVIFDGKVQDRTYHSWYRTAFLANIAPSGNPVVEGLPWVVSLKEATFRGEGGGGADPVRVSPPGIETISPYIVTEGDPTLTLVIQGFNFFNRSRVYFDNIAVPFQRVSPTELQVTIDESFLRRAGRFDIVVKNPGPLRVHDWGDGTSNKAHLLVDFRY